MNITGTSRGIDDNRIIFSPYVPTWAKGIDCLACVGIKVSNNHTSITKTDENAASCGCRADISSSALDSQAAGRSDNDFL